MAGSDRPGSIIREAETSQSYTLPPGMAPVGPCRRRMNGRGKLCGAAGKAMLDAKATMARPGRPVHDHRCEKHAFRP